MIEIATLGLAIDKSPVEETMNALDQLGAKGDAVGGRVGKAFTGTNAVARDVARTMGENVVQGSARAESSLRRVEFAAFQIIETGNLSAGSLRGLAMGMSGLVESAVPFIGIGLVVVETIKAITRANEEATKAAEAAAEAERKRIDQLSRPVVQLQRTPEQDIAALQNRAQANRERADTVIREAQAIDQNTASVRAYLPFGQQLVRLFGGENTDLIRDHAEALRRLAEIQEQNAAFSKKNDAANRAAQQAQAIQDYLRGLRDEAALLGLTGAALERETVIRRGYGAAVATTAAELRREIELRRAFADVGSLPGSGVTARDALTRAIEVQLRQAGALDRTSAAAAAYRIQQDLNTISAERNARVVQEQAALQELLNRKLDEGRKAGPTEQSKYGRGPGTPLNFSTGMGGFDAASGVLGAFTTGGILGAVGAIGGFIGSIFGAGDAARAAAERMRELQRSIGASITELRLQVEGNGLQQNLNAAVRQGESLRDQLREAYGLERGQASTDRRYLASLNEIVTLTAKRLEQIREEFALQQAQRQEDYRIRELRAQGASAEADALAFAAAQQREYARAVKEGADETTRAALQAAQAAEAAQRRETIARQQQQALEDLAVRGLRAGGDDAGADARAFALQQQREYNDAVRDGADAAYLAQLRQVQLAEATARTAATMQDTIDSYARTIGDLQTYRDSLRLNTQLSPLSPIQQLAEARRQYEVVLAAARGGDQSAASRLSQVGQTFLGLSRSVYASGPAYATQYNQVQKDVDDVLALFAGKKSDEQMLLEVLKGGIPIDGPIEIIPQPYPDEAPQRRQFDDMIGEQKRAVEGLAGTVAVLMAGFTEVSKKLDGVSDAVSRGQADVARALEGAGLRS